MSEAWSQPWASHLSSLPLCAANSVHCPRQSVGEPGARLPLAGCSHALDVALRLESAAIYRCFALPAAVIRLAIPNLRTVPQGSAPIQHAS